MKRPIAALVLTVCLFTGVYAYTSFVQSIAREPLQIQESFSNDKYTVRITRTCDLVGDDGFDEIYALHVRFRGKDLILKKSSLPKSEKIEKQLDEVTASENEISIKANVKLANQSSDDWGDEASTDLGEQRLDEQLGALRVQVLQGNQNIADQTIWQESGSTSISGSVSFTGTPPTQHDEH